MAKVNSVGALRDLRTLIRSAPDEVGRALFQETQIELNEVKRLTPVKTGALRASEIATGPFREGNKIWTEISAGGPTADYAFHVHEDMEAFHADGQAKYIEQPLRESAPYLAERIASRIDLKKLL